jgi:outer membrane protein assembly factor BamB
VGQVFAFDRETGAVRWKVKAQYGFPADFARSGASLFAANFAGELLALDIATGTVRWKYAGQPPGPDFTLPAAPAVLGDRVFFAERTGKISALDAATGKSVWSRDLKEQIRTSLVLEGSTLFLGTAGRRVYALDSVTGKTLSSQTVEDAPAGKPAISEDSVALLVGGDQKCCSSVVSLDRSLKQVRWKQKAPEGAQWDSPRPLVWKDSLLVGTDRGELHAFKLSDGSLLWKRQFKGSIRSIGAADGILYLGTLKGTVYAYDPAR